MLLASCAFLRMGCLLSPEMLHLECDAVTHFTFIQKLQLL